MEQEFIDGMKQSLIELRNEIIETLTANSAEFQKIADDTMDSKDVIDIASDDIDRKMLETLSESDSNRLKMIDEALVRIERGEYGLCTNCGSEIPRPRLEANPYAPLCIDCQRELERNRY